MILFSVQLYVTYHAESGDVGVGKNDITSILLFCIGFFLLHLNMLFISCGLLFYKILLAHVNVLIAFS